MLAAGRVLFAVAIGAFGLEYLLLGHFPGGLPPWPPWTPGAPFLTYALGFGLVIGAVGLVVPAFSTQAALGIGVAFAIGVLLHLVHASLMFTDPSEPTRVLEPLALCAAAFVLAGRLEIAARYVFALCLAAFGLQHFQFASFIASLIPGWIPLHLVLAYFTGCAMIAAGIAIATGVLARLGCALIGLMFFLWVVILHGPRVAAAPQNGDEWASLFVALAMAGASWIVASTFRRGKMDIV
jgi:uncharacterized membrane protein